MDFAMRCTLCALRSAINLTFLPVLATFRIEFAQTRLHF